MQQRQQLWQRKLLPMFTSAALKVLPEMATGVLSSLGSFRMDKILRQGQKGGFMLPQNKVDQLVAYRHLLTAKQKRDILNAMAF